MSSNSSQHDRVAAVLRANGPTAGDIFDTVSNRRMVDIRTFSLRGKYGGHDQNVYYLSSHDEQAVLEKYFEVNPDIIEDNAMRTVTQWVGNHGSAWREAFDAIKYDYFR